jgi:hypothetical protein
MLNDLVRDQLIADVQVALAEAFLDQATNDDLGSQWPVAIAVQRPCKSGVLLRVSYVRACLPVWVAGGFRSRSRTYGGAADGASGESPIWAPVRPWVFLPRVREGTPFI